jgi:hypothetical protein
MSLVSELVTSLLEMPSILTEVATTNPVAGVMLFFGSLFMGLSLVYFGVLTLGAILSVVSPEGGGDREYPQAR